MTRGIIYLASGGRSYLGELLTSLKTLRRHEPDLPVTVFSRFAVPRSMPCQSVQITSPEHPLKLKVLTLRESPYDETLFLDTDTSILGKVSDVFDQTAGADFAAANSHEADWTQKPPRFLSLVKPNDYNTGVLLYRKTAPTLEFLRRWEAAVLAQDPADMWAGHNCDQHYFNRVVAAGVREECGLRFQELDNVIWNARGCMVPEIRRIGRTADIRVLHHRTRAMKFRKLVFSVTDWQTVREIALKATGRLRPAAPAAGNA